MKTNITIKDKKTYFPPQIELIRLDNEISLQLASDTTPPVEPGGGDWDAKANSQINNDPYKMA